MGLMSALPGHLAWEFAAMWATKFPFLPELVLYSANKRILSSLYECTARMPHIHPSREPMSAAFSISQAMKWEDLIQKSSDMAQEAQGRVM